MNDFSFYSPTAITFGRGVLDRVGGLVRERGYERVLVVYGGGSQVRSGALQRLVDALDAAEVAHTEIGGVRPNPEVGLIREGVKLARKAQAGAVVALGGGSVIDTAKAIALGVCYTGDVWDLFVKRAAPTASLPVVAIPTIPASGSEASDSAVISNDAEHLKCGLNTNLNRPVMAVMDPELTFTLPAWQTAAGVTDMISHVLERFFSGEGPAPATDYLACALVRAAMEEGPRALAEPDNYEARANLMWIGTLSHNGLAGCGINVPGGRDGDWTCHGLEHELSARDTRITHGAGLAVVIPAWMRYVWRSHPERFLLFGREVFGIEPVDPAVDDLSDIDEEISPERAEHDAVEAIIDELQEFFVSLGMPRTLGELGITVDDIDALIAGLRQNRGEAFGSFQRLTLDDARAIYESAL